MPKLPDVNALGERQVPRPTGGVVSYNPTSGKEALVGQALTSLGETLGQIGQEAEKQRLRDDTRRAEDAFNQLRSQQLDLTTGQDGFVNKKSGNAVNEPLMENYVKRFDDAAKRIEDALGNDEQRQMFRRRAAVSSYQFKQNLLQHITNESRVYDEQVFKGTIATETQSAAANWSDPNAVGLSLTRIDAATSARAQDEGWADEFKNAVLLQERGKVHAAVVGQALAAGNFQYAKGWYDRYKGEVDPTTARSIQATIDNTLEKQIGQMTSIVLSGYDLSPEQVEPIVKAAKGTGQEQQALQLAATTKATGEFRRMLPAQQEAYLTNLEAQVRKDPTKFDVTMVSRFRTIYENQQRDLKESPVTFAVRQGFVKDGSLAAQPVDFSNPGAIGPQLSARFDLAREMRKVYGAEFKPLTPQESQQLSSALKLATATQKADYFGQLSLASGGDMDGYTAVMRQIAPDDPVTAIAGVYAGRNRRVASDLMLKGQELLRPSTKEDGRPDKGKLWPMPPESELRKEFESETRDAFAGHPQAQSDLYQAAISIYAAKSAQEGDSSGIIDDDRMEESIRLATGGIERWNGKSTVLPYGMDFSQFKDGLYKRIDEAVVLRDLNVNTAMLRDLPLEAVGDGRYVFRSGDGVIVDKQKRPVVIDFNKRPLEGVFR